MDVNEICPAPHLEAADLKGAEQVVTIKSFSGNVEVGAERVQRTVVFFEEYKRGLVLNRTNTKRLISKFHGVADTDGMIGKTITLYPSEADFNGDTVPCIRIKKENA